MRLLGSSDSLIVAVVNVVLSALAYLLLRTAAWDFLGLIAVLTICPLLVLVTLLFSLRDIRRVEKRVYGYVALGLCVIPVSVLLSIRVEF